MHFFSKLFRRLTRLSNEFIFIVAAAFVSGSSFLIYLLEPDTFGSPFNGFWWVMTTVTTVGYGDFYPHTAAGKCLGILLYIFGISFISIAISKAIDSILIYRRKREEGLLQYTGEQHFVMIDWSKHSSLAIQEILNSDPRVEVVLIADLEKTPIPHERVHYIRGNPVQKSTLDLANLAKAKAVFIFADETTQQQHFIRDTSFVDGKTLLIATSIERFYAHVYTIVEIKDRENIHNFTHVKVNEFILGTEIVSQIAVRSAFNPGASKLVSQLLSWQGEDLYEIRKKPHWSTYRDAFEELLAHGATLLSDGEQMNINRRLDETIADNSRLFVVCDKDTYLKLLKA